jgi:hypothetical protein
VSSFVPEPQDDLGILLPILDEPQDELAEIEALTDEIDALDSDDLIVEEDERPPLGRSWGFDFQRGRFIRAGGKGPLSIHGIHTLEQWIEKCLRTARYAHVVHSPRFGIDRPFSMFGQPAAAFPDDYEDRVREGLLNHPRIDDVTDFVVETDAADDFAQVSFTVHFDGTEPLRFTTTLVVA